jgi:dTDP-4-dehydrorhamnose reductase
MIVLLGASGYVGEAFHRELLARGKGVWALPRKQVDYTRYDILVQILRDIRPHLLINAAGFTGRPNVDACELAKADTLHGNALFPLTVSHACQSTGIPWAHVSSGCIFDGTKVIHNGRLQVESDLKQEVVRQLIVSRSELVRGFDENDEPNFSFRHPPCSFYSGSKALAEEALRADERVYIWRLRMPFDEQDGPRNYLSKLQRYTKIYENFNSLSHRGDFVQACLDLVKTGAPYGTYNVTNPGYASSREICQLIQRHLAPDREFHYWENDEDFYQTAAKAPRSNCILSVSKLQSSGAYIRTLEEALEHSLTKWQWESKVTKPVHINRSGDVLTL